jgi:hypothetical protein
MENARTEILSAYTTVSMALRATTRGPLCTAVVELFRIFQVEFLPKLWMNNFHRPQ